MRLDADDRGGRAKRVVWLVALATVSVTCAKTWVLGPTQGAAGAGALGSGGSGAAGGAPGFGGFPGFGGRSDPGTGGHSGSMCSTKLMFDIPTADMIFLVGRNQSMSTPFGDSTRMIAVQTAINQLLTATNPSAVSFGYQDFPSLTSCANGTTCCPSTDPAVYPAIYNSGAINGSLRYCGTGQPMNGCVAPNNSRSMSQTLNTLTNLFAPSDMPGGRFVVLVTDGPPGCETDDPDKACMTLGTSVAMLNRVSVKTYVIDINDTATPDSCLQEVALMGGTSAPVFNVMDPTSLSVALTQIVNDPSAAPASCTIELTEQPAKAELVSVLLQDCEIQFDQSDKDGWDFAPGSTVRLEVHGSACKSLQTLRPTDVTVRYGCAPRTTPNNACP